ncbi:MAG: hemerythrin family protein [Hyphomicrobiales bacterium]|nr:hemerythrin family protein [Hyphomicrobiales bacterium]
MVIAWSEAMSVGVPELDNDHRCLIRIINLLSNVTGRYPGRTVETVLETLLLYSKFHFAREERVLASSRFPAAVFHHGEHEGFTRNIRRLRDRYKGGDSPKVARELLDYLTGWLTHHILIQDMAYKPYVMDDNTMDSLALQAAPDLYDAAVEQFQTNGVPYVCSEREPQ